MKRVSALYWPAPEETIHHNIAAGPLEEIFVYTWNVLATQEIVGRCLHVLSPSPAKPFSFSSRSLPKNLSPLLRTSPFFPLSADLEGPATLD